MSVALRDFRPLSEWTVSEAANVLGAAAPRVGGDCAFGPISTDTRTLHRGDIFLALRGERFDGHAHTGEAVARGAAALIVERGFSPEFDDRLPVIRVEDPVTAYGDLAQAQRRAWGGPVLAISGSVGKTATRRLTALALGSRHRVLEPLRNFNNLIGLPQTLLRLERSHQAAVLELGMNQPGELARLTRIAEPTVAGLTRIGRAHVGMFNSIEELIEAKLSLFENTASGVPLVVNAACANSRRAISRFAASHPIVTFRAEGTEQADCRIENVSTVAPVGFRFDLATPASTMKGLTLRHFARHLIEDVAAAAAMLIAGGYDPEMMAEAVAKFRSEPLRGEIVEAGPYTFILDCYNAAPEAMLGALRAMRELPAAGRNVLVLADMLELGDLSAATHDGLLPALRDLAPAALFTLGPEMARLAGLLRAEGWETHSFNKSEELIEGLRASLRDGDRVLFKGSHSFALEQVAEAVSGIQFAQGGSH